MIKNILGVIIGYIVMAVFIFLTFTVVYLILGADGSFEPLSYKVSAIWIVISIILSLTAAILGGWICTAIAKNQKAGMVLAAIVLVLGVIFAIPTLNLSDEEMNKVREGNVPNLEAMQNAKQPASSALLNPILGAAGIFIGTRLRSRKMN